MRVLGPASENDLPSGLRDALTSEDVAYCMTCDGLRVNGHECVDPWPENAEP